MAATQPRQNYHAESEAGVNKQINLELYASYVYQSMAFYFDRDDIALKDFHKFFSKSSEEEREHAEKLMKFQNQREAGSFSKTFRNQREMNGELDLRRCRQPSLWRKTSTSLCSICTSWLTLMATLR